MIVGCGAVAVRVQWLGKAAMPSIMLRAQCTAKGRGGQLATLDFQTKAMLPIAYNRHMYDISNPFFD
jgi:hypothetical protein